MEVDVLGSLKFGGCSPQQDGCPSDGMSSDATVLCIDSDVEDETQSQDAFAPELDSRLQEKALQGGPEPITKFQTCPQSPAACGKDVLGEGRTTMNGSRPKFFAKASDAEVLRETASFETMGKVSWGREQDHVDLAALGAAAGDQGKRVPCEGEGPPLSVLCTQEDKREGNSMQSDSGKKKKRNKNKKNVDTWQPTEEERMDGDQNAVEPTFQVQATQQPVHQKGRRRGRRGGRGRKQMEADVQENVPKLEMNLEEDLAEQLANQASNDSALSMGFSSIRLHVPGGNTMIILNDHELRDGTTPDDILEKIESSLPNSERTAGTDHTTGATLVDCVAADGAAFRGTCHEKTHSKGCGAFFPPSLLKEMLNEPLVVTSRPAQRPTHRRMRSENVDSVSGDQKLNIGAHPFVPFSSFSLNDYRSASAASFGSAERQVALLPADILPEQIGDAQKAKTGTGCFIPMYSRGVMVKRQEPPKHVARESLAESLSSLDDVSFSTRRNRLQFQVPALEAAKDVCSDTLFDEESDVGSEDRNGSEMGLGMLSSPRCPLGNNVGAVQGDCARGVAEELSAVERPDNPQDELMQLLEGSKFTSFTSPLHLEETLDGLQEEREARESAESRLVELEMENLELRGGSGKMGDLQSELSKAQEAARAMQVLLFAALAKSDNLRFKPKGMFRYTSKRCTSELVAAESKLTKTMKSTKTAVPKKDTAKGSVADTENANTTTRKARSLSAADLKLARSRPSHARTVSASTPAVSKVVSARAKVTETTKTTTTTKLQMTTEETTTTKERKAVKKASTVPLTPPLRKSKTIQSRWH